MAFSTFNGFQSFLTFVKLKVASGLGYTYNFPAIDPSLVLYYPFDTSANITNGFQTPNFASQLPVYDASMAGSSMISYQKGAYITSLGDLSLNNTMGSETATNYIVANNTVTLIPSSGFTLSCWFSCSGELNTVGTLLSLPLNITGTLYNGIELDISGLNMIQSGYYTAAPIPPVPTNGLIMYWPFDTNMNESITGAVPTVVGNAAITTTNKIRGTGSLDGTSATNSYIKFYNASGFLPASSNGYTISFWFNLQVQPSGGAFRYLFSFQDTIPENAANTIMLYFVPGTTNIKLSLYNAGTWANGDDYIVAASSAIQLNTWNHVAISVPTGVTGSTVKTNHLVNGVYTTGPAITTQAVSTASRKDCYINSNTFAQDKTQAYIDEFRVYNRILSEAEMRLLYVN